MTILSHEIDIVAGGFSAYDTGVTIGAAARAAVALLAEMGKDYTPTL